MFLGIDNGFSGGLAVFDGIRLVDAIPTPTVDVTKTTKTAKGNERKGREINEAEIANFIRKYNPVHAVIELAHAFPGQGAVSMFSFGVSFGTVRGIVGALGVPFTVVPSQTWQKELLGGRRAAGQSKEDAAATAQRLFPGFNFVAPGSRKLHEGMVDAALMAVYCHRMHSGANAVGRMSDIEVVHMPMQQPMSPSVAFVDTAVPEPVTVPKKPNLW